MINLKILIEKYGLRLIFITIILVSFVIVFGFFLSFFISQQRNLITDELRARGRILALTVAYDIEYGILTGGETLVRQLVRNVGEQRDVAYIEVMDEKGEILAGYYPIGNPRRLLEREDLERDEATAKYTTSLEGESIFEFLVPVLLHEIEEAESDWIIEQKTEEERKAEDTRIKKIGFVRLGLSLKNTYGNIYRLRNFSILSISTAFILLALIFSFFMDKIIIKPIHQFTKGAEAIASGDLDHKIQFNRKDEIGQLADSFNKMAQNLKKDITIIRDSEKKLKEYSENLEGKVKERTSALEGKTEELLKANIKLQELDHLKSMFIASMSHELRTPLNSIIGFTGILLMGMTGDLTEEQRKQMTLVKNSANHLLNLINDIIDKSKIEAGKAEVLVEQFDLSTIMQEVMDSLKVAADKKGLEMPLKLPKELLIKSDERRVKQIIVNLVGNAVKFTDKGEVEMKVAEKDGMVEVSVRDTGPGIKKEHMDKLFKAFSQIPTEGEIKEGTGLGLHLSRKIAGLLGGEISAESEFGKGSTFTLSLPLEYKEKEA